MSDAAIGSENLVKVYKEKSSRPVLALDGLTLDVREGEIFGLLGRNGAGKTTFLRIITTLLPPTSGKASVLGLDVTRAALEVRKNICVVLQENAVELYLSVMDNLATFARFHSILRGEIERRAKRVIEQFGLGEHVNQKVIDLSGGLKRRLQVAKVFMVDKPVVFLDEATTGMDPINKRTTIEAIREEARKGRTIFLTTHILQEAEELCDSIAIIDRGQCVAKGDPQTIKSLVANILEVTLTFDPLSEAVLNELRQLDLITFAHRNNTVELCVRGGQVSLLELITKLSREHKVVHFEINSPTLEDAFIELLGRNLHPTEGASV
ncbi:MAG: ABC transporter ATP-binding protein [Ignavibacteriae bacterium]|nr:ABC transporter ATP-binding protein [Ignavibacteriota bacterium]